MAEDPLVELIRNTIKGSTYWSSVEYHVAAKLRENPDVVLRALNLRLCGYLCPECHTWAEDMEPHCFNEHADDPVRTLPFYLDDRMRKV